MPAQTGVCPSCGSPRRHARDNLIASPAPGAVDLLPGLETGWGILSPAAFRVVVCADCGLMQLREQNGTRQPHLVTGLAPGVSFDPTLPCYHRRPVNCSWRWCI